MEYLAEVAYYLQGIRTFTHFPPPANPVPKHVQRVCQPVPWQNADRHCYALPSASIDASVLNPRPNTWLYLKHRPHVLAAIIWAPIGSHTTSSVNFKFVSFPQYWTVIYVYFYYRTFTWEILGCKGRSILFQKQRRIADSGEVRGCGFSPESHCSVTHNATLNYSLMRMLIDLVAIEPLRWRPYFFNRILTQTSTSHLPSFHYSATYTLHHYSLTRDQSYILLLKGQVWREHLGHLLPPTRRLVQSYCDL